MILFGLATTTRRRAWLCSRFFEFWSLPKTLFAFFSPQGRSTPSHMEDHPPHRPKYGDIWSHPLPVHVIDPPQQRRVGENSSSIRDPVLRRRVFRSEPGPFISPSYTHITDMHPCSPHMCADGHSRARLRGPAPMRFSRRVSRDTSRRTRQPRAACLARIRTSSSLEAERRPDGNDTARERGSVGSTGAPCPARVAPAWGGGAGETTSGAEQIGIRPKHRHIDISYTTYASQYTKSHRPSRTHRHGTARAPPFPLCNPRVPPVTRKDSATALAYYPALSPPKRPQRLQRPQSTPLTSPPRRHSHLNP